VNGDGDARVRARVRRAARSLHERRDGPGAAVAGAERSPRSPPIVPGNRPPPKRPNIAIRSIFYFFLLMT
jgi:hypothetical protein